MPFLLDAVNSGLAYYFKAGHVVLIVIGLIVIGAVLVAARVVMVRRHSRKGGRH
ncbi:hypothetical protein [Actinomadura logoneensis]|uniref:hypothetical protein n=1 Tax=Actinomadura logoneensis TaxID=2293572 RepID=UPI001314A6A8|nr:hypothetical protein [Actinomadura logoneensis]